MSAGLSFNQSMMLGAMRAQRYQVYTVQWAQRLLTGTRNYTHREPFRESVYRAFVSMERRRLVERKGTDWTGMQTWALTALGKELDSPATL